MSRRAFTLIELVIVLTIMAVLMGMSAPGVLRALYRGRVNQAAESIITAHALARRLAMTTAPAGPIVPSDAVAGFGPASPHYGVRISTGSTQPVVEVIRATGSADPGLAVVATYDLAGGVVVRTAANPQNQPQPLNGTLVWFYRYGSGQPIASSMAKDINVAIDIGLPGWSSTGDPNRPRASTISTAWGSDAIGIVSPNSFPGSPVCGYLEVATRDAEHRLSVLIMRNGIAHSQEPAP